jgi:hypothetical protein
MNKENLNKSKTLHKYRLILNTTSDSEEQKFNNNINDNTTQSQEKIEENKYEQNTKFNERFNELRKDYKSIEADKEAEAYINELRNRGEYNRWSLKLIQRWLLMFYQGKRNN